MLYATTRSEALQRSIRMSRRKTFLQKKLAKPLTKEQKIAAELRKLGVSSLAMLTEESRYLPKIIHDNERIMGIVYGRHTDGFAMLVATDRRVVFLDKKPMFVNEDEVTYDVVSGIAMSSNGVGVTVTLHTRVKDYKIRTFNNHCARGFVSYIETRRVERLNGGTL